MLHPFVIIELFDLRTKLSDDIIEFVSDELEKTDIRVDKVENLDTKVYLEFSYPKLGAMNEDFGFKLNGNVIIDRMQQLYEVSAKLFVNEAFGNSFDYAGIVTRDFDEVMRYIKLLNDDIDVYTTNIFVESHMHNGVISEKSHNYSARHTLNKLSDPAKSTLARLCSLYNDGDGPYIFTMADIRAMDGASIAELVKYGYLTHDGQNYILNRTEADSYRSISAGN